MRACIVHDKNLAFIYLFFFNCTFCDGGRIVINVTQAHVLLTTNSALTKQPSGSQNKTEKSNYE